MSDIEILLRELNERMDFLFQKVDILNKKVDYLNSKIKMTINAQYGSIWGDDSTPPTPLPLRTTEEIKTQ